MQGLYSTNATVGYITTTGLGIVRGWNVLFAPFDSNQSYVDLGVDTLEEWRLSGLSENHFGLSVNRWCFGFHNSCWELLLLRLAHGPDNALQGAAAISESVFYQLSCTPCIQASIFQFGHDYRARRKHTNPSGCQKQWI